MNTSDNGNRDLEKAAWRFASRRMDIPPTPRDTMAVLRAAAEQQRSSSTAPVTPPLIHGLLALAACAVLLVAVWFYDRETPTAPIASTAMTNPDLGLDLADWDLEFDAIYADLSESLETVEGEGNTL